MTLLNARPADISAATPLTRDRVIDFIRASSLLVVIAGHWLMATIVVADGAISGSNALESLPYLRPLTWVLQVMPVFFVAGGFANVTVWRGVRRRGAGYTVYMQGRMLRLVRPTLVFVVATIGALAGLRLAGVGDEEVELVGRLLGQPLWFLGIYVAVTALVPALDYCHTRRPVGTALALLGTAIAVDVIRLAWVDGVGYLNFAAVWLFTALLGVWHADRRLAGLSRRSLWAVLHVVGGSLVVLTTIGPHPVSMIGLPGEMSNMTPPSICLLLLGIGQVAAVTLARPRLTTWLARPGPWATVVAMGSMGMTMYLWHLAVLVAGFALMLWLGVTVPDPGSGWWWLTRPAWIAFLGLLLVVVATCMARIEKALSAQPDGRRRRSMSFPATLLGVALATSGLVGFVLHGLAPPSMYVLVSTLALLTGMLVTTSGRIRG